MAKSKAADRLKELNENLNKKENENLRAALKDVRDGFSKEGHDALTTVSKELPLLLSAEPTEASFRHGIDRLAAVLAAIDRAQVEIGTVLQSLRSAMEQATGEPMAEYQEAIETNRLRTKALEANQKALAEVLRQARAEAEQSGGDDGPLEVKVAALRAQVAKKVLAGGPAADEAPKVSAQVAAVSLFEQRGSGQNPVRVQMKRADLEPTEDTALWFQIRRATLDIGWEAYAQFMESVLCKGPTQGEDVRTSAARDKLKHSKIQLPFPGVEPYRVVKAATEVFLLVNCATQRDAFTEQELAYGKRRMGRSFTDTEIQEQWKSYLTKLPTDRYGANTIEVLPYLALIRDKLQEQPIVDWPIDGDFHRAHQGCAGIIQRKLQLPCFLELIWSYWQEEGMLVQSMNALSQRFQNVLPSGSRNPLAMVEIDPLRPLNTLLWGYVQDEQHRLTARRRNQQYRYQYGLALKGKAIPEERGADERTQFLEAFHTLLHVCVGFFAADDDTTVVADGFPVLNALRDVHIQLTQGAHNQYGDLPWTARQEMMMQQWLLARPEMREFLPTRTMVAYPEPWMDRVDAMKSLLGWTDTSVLHFRELAIYGERILLGIRFNDWTSQVEMERAANWARFWRPEIQGYIHAYRAAVGVDLTQRPDATMPSTLLQGRLSRQLAAVR